MTTACARHILVPTEEQANDLKRQLDEGADFGELAQQFSTCPSGRSGGDLGEFSPGQMVREFNDVCFSEAVGEVHGSVKTQFGYHLIQVTKRT